MADGRCKCGCGNSLSDKNKNGYFRGHTPKGLVTTKKGKASPGTALETISPVEEIEYAPEMVSMEVTEQQLDRIYALLPITEKALGVLTALTADRS